MDRDVISGRLYGMQTSAADRPERSQSVVGGRRLAAAPRARGVVPRRLILNDVSRG